MHSCAPQHDPRSSRDRRQSVRRQIKQPNLNTDRPNIDRRREHIYISRIITKCWRSKQNKYHWNSRRFFGGDISIDGWIGRLALLWSCLVMVIFKDVIQIYRAYRKTPRRNFGSGTENWPLRKTQNLITIHRQFNASAIAQFWDLMIWFSHLLYECG